LTLASETSPRLPNDRPPLDSVARQYIKEKTMNDQSMTVRGKDRYKSGVMEYKKMGY
jgi:ribulose-bisphosphate carboxylase large chain